MLTEDFLPLHGDLDHRWRYRNGSLTEACRARNCVVLNSFISRSDLLDQSGIGRAGCCHRADLCRQRAILRSTTGRFLTCNIDPVQINSLVPVQQRNDLAGAMLALGLLMRVTKRLMGSLFIPAFPFHSPMESNSATQLPLCDTFSDNQFR